MGLAKFKVGDRVFVEWLQLRGYAIISPYKGKHYSKGYYHFRMDNMKYYDRELTLDAHSAPEDYIRLATPLEELL